MICACIFFIIGYLVEAGAKTRGMREEHAPGPASFFSYTLSSFSYHRCPFLFQLPLFISLICTITLYTFSLRRLVRRCIVPKVLTLGHKIHTLKYKERTHSFAYIIVHLYLSLLHKTMIGIQNLRTHYIVV